MKVKDLIEILSKLDQEKEIYSKYEGGSPQDHEKIKKEQYNGEEWYTF